MVKHITIALVLLLGLPVPGPLLQKAPCCEGRQECAPAMRSYDSCCSLSALPDTTTPARIAIPPELAAPAMAGLAWDAAEVPLDAPTAVFHVTQTAFLRTPLRI